MRNHRIVVSRRGEPAVLRRIDEEPPGPTRPSSAAIMPGKFVLVIAPLP